MRTLEQVNQEIEITKTKIAIYSERDMETTKAYEDHLAKLNNEWLELDIEANKVG